MPWVKDEIFPIAKIGRISVPFHSFFPFRLKCPTSGSFPVLEHGDPDSRIYLTRKSLRTLKAYLVKGR